MARAHTLALIPARGGSRRLPGKNLKLLLGKPLIAHVIAAARQVRQLDALVVSTDSPAIARVARRYGAAVVRRPAALATATAPVAAAVRHAVAAYERARGVTVGTIVLLQPTTPTTTPADIRACLRLLRGGCDTALTVARVDDRPEWVGTRNRQGRFRKYFTAAAARRMAALAFFQPSGGVYAARGRHFARTGLFTTGRCGSVVVPPERNTDIDTLADFHAAAALLRRQKGQRR